LNLKRSLALALSLLMVLGVVIPAIAATERISGADRYATAVEISKQGWDSSDVVVLASGLDFPDALAGVPLAFQLQAPILLTQKDVLPAVTKAEIERLGAEEVVILGGLTAVSQAVEDALKALDLEVTRIAGADRYETAALIAAELAEIVEFDTAFVVFGGNYPDALAAASYAARLGMPILLTATNFIPDFTQDAISDLEIKDVYAIGGTSVISNTVLNALPNANRIYGSTREATSLELAKRFGVNEEMVYFATGYNYADAIAGGVLAAKNDSGILLVGKTLPADMAAFLGDISGVTIFGGKNAVSDDVLDAILEAIVTPDEDATEIHIESATAVSNTQVRVILADAPLKNLAATDFRIKPALTITSVTTVDNVVTLTTSPQSATNYTITPANGTGSATFTGKGAVSATAAISNIELLNMRQIRIDFNSLVVWTGTDGAGNADNYYIGLTEEENGNLEAVSLTELLSNRAWTLVSDEDMVDDNAVDHVIIEATDGATVLEMLAAGGLTLNETVTIEARNIKQANSGRINTSQGAFKVEDKVAPSVEGIEVITEDADGDWLDNPYLEILFTEPINPYTGNDDFIIYVNNVAYAVDELDNVVTNGTVLEHQTMYIDLTDYEKDVKHNIKIVGATDLRNNMQTPNIWEDEFIIPSEETVDPTYTRPAVEKVVQIADNMLAVYFNQGKIVPAAEGKVVTIVDGVWNGDEWVDLVINSSDITSVVVAKKTVWLVDYKACFTKEEQAAATFNFDGQDASIRKVIVENYKIENFPTGWDGLKYNENITFVNDKTAPVVSDTRYSVAGGKLYIAFNDAPFGGIVQDGNGRLLVSMTTAEGKTRSEYFAIGEEAKITDDDYVPVGTTVVFEANKYMTIAIPAESELTDDNGNLFDGAVYTVHFERGNVWDANDDDEVKVRQVWRQENVPADLEFEGYHPLAPVSRSITIPKGAAAPASEGRVPQTSIGLIQSGRDMFKDGAIAINAGWGDETTVGAYDYMIKEANQNKILVVFDGEVDPASAVRKSNYTYNGKQLPEGSTIAYYESTASEQVDTKISRGYTADMSEWNRPYPHGWMVSGSYTGEFDGQIKIQTKDTNSFWLIEGGTVTEMAWSHGTYSLPFPWGSWGWGYRYATYEGITFRTDYDDDQVLLIDAYYDEIPVMSGGMNDNLRGNKGAYGDKIGYVVITLPDGSVPVTGAYTIGVQNVTNLQGKKMLPVLDNVRLVDNTAPVPVSLVVKGSKELQVTFNEPINLANTDLARNNLHVQVGNMVYAVEKITVVNEKQFIITVAQDFAIGDKATVTFKEFDSLMWFEDLEGNGVKHNTQISNK
jgi:putative cell wall-binding protein